MQLLDRAPRCREYFIDSSQISNAFMDNLKLHCANEINFLNSELASAE